LSESLECYSLCERHYNQIVATDQLLKHLETVDAPTSTFFINANRFKRSRYTIGQQTMVNQNSYSNQREIGVQVSPTFNETETQTKRPFFGFQQQEIIEKYQQAINELNFQVKHLLFENQRLKEQWESKFSNQSKRVAAIIEIAQKERENVYNDIISLIEDQERFSLDNLLDYSVSQ
jgi:hypothetical protein